MLIDAHQHFWTIGENGHSWPPSELDAIYRNFGPEDWLDAARPVGITGSVLVQAQPDADETEWLITLSEKIPFVKAVVGWADLKAGTAARRIAELASRPKLKGLRPMLQDLPPDWIEDPALEPAIAAMVEHGLRFDALVFTRHLPQLRAFAKRWPELPIVIDHGAKPPIAMGDLEPWRSEIARLAELPNIFCKLSGLFTEMGADQPRSSLDPYFAHLKSAFGAERMMWGSDWPVVLLASTYEDWFQMAADLTASGSTDCAALFGGTAAAFYGIENA